MELWFTQYLIINNLSYCMISIVFVLYLLFTLSCHFIKNPWIICCNLTQHPCHTKFYIYKVRMLNELNELKCLSLMSWLIVMYWTTLYHFYNAYNIVIYLHRQHEQQNVKNSAVYIILMLSIVVKLIFMRNVQWLRDLKALQLKKRMQIEETLAN